MPAQAPSLIHRGASAHVPDRCHRWPIARSSRAERVHLDRASEAEHVALDNRDAADERFHRPNDGRSAWSRCSWRDSTAKQHSRPARSAERDGSLPPLRHRRMGFESRAPQCLRSLRRRSR